MEEKKEEEEEEKEEEKEEITTTMQSSAAIQQSYTHGQGICFFPVNQEKERRKRRRRRTSSRRRMRSRYNAIFHSNAAELYSWAKAIVSSAQGGESSQTSPTACR